MSLEEIGFYTLSDERAKNASTTSKLQRCELLLTDKCNFKCPYCRGPNKHTGGTLTFDEAKHVVNLWASHDLKNVRFSGGEPTVLPYLPELIRHTKRAGVERIAISTNGSADTALYRELVESGVNDFSVSLDACCASTGDTMAGGIPGVWTKVTKNIKVLSSLAYVTVGVVLTDTNFEELPEIIRFAASLGVSDIRIISAAQWNNEQKFRELFKDRDILGKYPILAYRIENFQKGRNVRGIKEQDCHRCYLMLDDMVVANNSHFTCVIAMREGCKPVGSILGKTMAQIREERADWLIKNDTFCNKICKNNCLDVCVDYNNEAGKWKN